MIQKPFWLAAAISLMTASVSAVFAQSTVPNQANSLRAIPRLPVSGIARDAIEKATLPAPAIFAPGVISGPGNDGTPTFSPDGRTLYFYRYGTSPDSAVIFESHRTSAGWSKPVAAPFSGPSSDRQPALARRSHARLCFTAQASFRLWGTASIRDQSLACDTHGIRLVRARPLAGYRQYLREDAQPVDRGGW